MNSLCMQPTEVTTLLIVDDSEINRALLRELLENEYEIIEADNGIKALEVMRRRKHDIAVVILDIIMPVMNGYEVLEEKRKDAKIADIPVIVVTSMSDVHSEVHALELGAADLIAKPYDTQIVSRRIKSVIEQREMERMRIENALLREQNQAQIQLKAILDNMLGGVVLMEAGDSFKSIYLNKGFYELGQYTPEEFAEHEDDILFFLRDVDYKKLRGIALAAIEAREPFTCECCARAKDGSSFWVQIRGTEIKYPTSDYPVLLAIITDITQLKKTEEELRYSAEFDQLTGIPNKASFYRSTEKLLKEKSDTEYVLVRWNIERFKVINDLLGTETGDLILKQLAYNLKTTMPENSTYGRLEADHFVLCFPKNMLNINEMTTRIENIFKRQKINYDIVVDIGIYFIHNRAVPVFQMCDRANLALQTIKGNYQKRYAFYDENLRRILIEEQEIIGDMNSALERGEFKVYFQPIYSALSSEPVAAEALVRWIHPRKGIISPGKFIPLFERNGFIEKMDYYVWEEVCKYIKKRREEHLPEIPISINISRVNLYNVNLCDDIINLVEKYGVTPSQLKLEITESAYTDNPDQLLKTMVGLQAYGFQILMDDFGSGYSSLNMLKDVPVDILKVDMRFVDGIENSNRAGNILTSVVRMAKWLGIPVVVEGVETQTQVDFLKSIGCDNIQGFYYSRPLPEGEFEEFIKEDIKHTVKPIKNVNGIEDLDSLFTGNELINRLINSVIGGLGVYEFTGTSLDVIRVNDVYYDVLGYDPLATGNSSSNLFDNLFEEDRAAVFEACKTAIATGKVSSADIRRYRYDGSIVWLNISLRHLGGSDDHPLICVTFNDVTKHKITELIMEQQKTAISRHYTYLETMYDSMICGVVQYSLDEDPQLIGANRAACAIFGYPDEEAFFDAVGCNVIKGVHPDDVDYVLEIFRLFFATHEQTSYEHRILHSDGSAVWIRGVLGEVRDIDDNNVVQSIFVDVTEQKENVLRAEAAAEALEKQKGYYQQLYDSIPCGIINYTLDEPPIVLDGNTAAKKMFGIPPYASLSDYLKENNKDFFDFICDDEREYLSELLGSFNESRKATNYEHKIIKTDGSIIWISGSIQEFVTLDGDIIAQSTFIDVTSQKSLHKRN